MTTSISSPASVLQTLNRVNASLDRLLSELGAYSDADVLLRQLAHDVTAAVQRDPDIALACIFLNQIGGRYAVRHCLETAIIACLIGRSMGKSELDLLTITAAAMTMNVGMMRQIESFQNKETALTPQEREMLRRHPGESAELLRHAGVTDEQWLACVLAHHENEDGSGYPEGKLGEAIPQNAKLIGLADRYCACVSARNYRRSMLPPLALAKLCDESPAVDRTLVEHFFERVGAYPPGTLVRLGSGEIGVVSHRGEHGELGVHALRDAEGKTITPTARVDAEIAEALHEDHARVRFSMKKVWGELASL